MKKFEKIGIIIGLILLITWILFPLYWMLNISFQTELEARTNPIHFFPANPSIQNFWFMFHVKEAFEATQQKEAASATYIQYLPASAAWFARSILNSLLVGITIMSINIFAGMLAAYTFTRIKFKGSQPLFYMTLSGRLIPPVAIVIPFYIIVKNLGLLDSPLAVIMVHTAFTLPVSIWILLTYIPMAIPEDIEKAAMIDGYSRLEVLRKIVFKLLKPGLVAVGIFSFMLSYGEFFFAFIVTQTYRSKTIPVIVASIVENPLSPVTLLMAAGTLAIIPPLVIAIVFRRYLIRGLVAGAVR